MPLTKAEFDKWRAQADEAIKALGGKPKCSVGWIDLDGSLQSTSLTHRPTETRALYEMLRAWYGESVMTEKAKAVIRVVEEYRDLLGFNPAYQFSASERAIVEAVDAYRAEQKQ